MIYVFLANGFEEIEALAPVDILRRAELEVKTVGVGGKTITGSHGITVTADIEEKDVTTDDMELMILPGGMPGTLNLEKSPIVTTCAEYCAKNDIYLAAICAAPSVLGHLGLLNGKEAICFPGFEGELKGATISEKPVCVDAMRIYDSCSDKDCLEDLRVLFPASVQPVVDASANVRVRDVDVISVYIDMQPIPFNRGYYSIDLTFFFDVSLEL